MAHTSREKYFGYLRERLGEVPFSIDQGWGIWENCKRAWQMRNPKADFHVVIQDDAIICDRFRERAEQILSTERGTAYSFYYGRRGNKTREAREGLQRGFIVKEWISWGLAICLPKHIIGEMMGRFSNVRNRHDDSMIAKFLKEKGIKIYFPIPSLVDHRAGEISLVGDPGKNRQAAYFIDNENK